VTCARQIIRFDPGVGTADRSISSVNLVLFSSDAETTGSASNEGGGGASSARHTAARARMPLFGWTSRARDAAAAASAASAAASPPPAPATPTRGSRDARRRGSSGDVVLSVDADNAAVSVPRELGAGERARASTPPPRLSAEEEEEEEEEKNAVDVELGEIRVVPADGASSEKEKGKKAEKKDDDDDDDERYCRICMERIARAELDAGTATSLGCACVGGFAHVDPCAEQYANTKSDATCEVRVFFFLAYFLVLVLSKPLILARAQLCLENMDALDAIVAKLRASRRGRARGRRAILVLNDLPTGAGGRAIRSRENDAHGDPVFDVEDARLYRPGWGSRNPGLWLLWIITRPFVLVAYVSLYFVTCLVVAMAVPAVILFCPEFLDASFFFPDVSIQPEASPS
jgi:hypothetical protein